MKNVIFTSCIKIVKMKAFKPCEGNNFYLKYSRVFHITYITIIFKIYISKSVECRRAFFARKFGRVQCGNEIVDQLAKEAAISSPLHPPVPKDIKAFFTIGHTKRTHQYLFNGTKEIHLSPLPIIHLIHYCTHFSRKKFSIK